jgi:hypothetical protein
MSANVFTPNNLKRAVGWALPTASYAARLRYEGLSRNRPTARLRLAPAAKRRQEYSHGRKPVVTAKKKVPQAPEGRHNGEAITHIRLQPMKQTKHQQRQKRPVTAERQRSPAVPAGEGGTRITSDPAAGWYSGLFGRIPLAARPLGHWARHGRSSIVRSAHALYLPPQKTHEIGDVI